MESFYGKLLNCILIWLAISALVVCTNDASNAEHDYELNPSNDNERVAEEALLLPKFYVTKKLSEFLGGPGKRFNYDRSAYYVNKKLSEFLGGPGKRFQPKSPHYMEKKLSEFLGGPGRR